MRSRERRVFQDLTVSCCLRSLCLHHVLVGRGGEKVTLGSFLFRDDCHSLLLRLVTVSSSISKIHGVSPAVATGAVSRASLEGSSVARDEQPAENAPPEPSESAPGTAISRALAVASRPCDKFETMVEAVLPCTTAQVLDESASRMLLYPSAGGLLLAVSNPAGRCCRDRVSFRL